MIRAAVLLILLSGCATTTPQATISVPVPCVSKAPERPVYRFQMLPKPQTPTEQAEAVRALYLDWLDADSYGRQWEAATAGCIK